MEDSDIAKFEETFRAAFPSPSDASGKIEDSITSEPPVDDKKTASDKASDNTDEKKAKRAAAVKHAENIFDHVMGIMFGCPGFKSPNPDYSSASDASESTPAPSEPQKEELIAPSTQEEYENDLMCAIAASLDSPKSASEPLLAPSTSQDASSFPDFQATLPSRPAASDASDSDAPAVVDGSVEEEFVVC